MSAAMTPLVLRATRSTAIAGHWLHLNMLGALCWISYHSGVQGAGLAWFALLPLLALMANGARAGLVWAALNAAAVSTLCAMKLAGYRFPNWMGPITMQLIEWMILLSVIGGAMWVVVICERQQEESNRQLREALEQADAASRVKSAFLANTSHELRTPMNGVVGMTTLLMTTDMSSEQREYVRTIHESSESLLAVIDDILDFSQLDANKLKLARLEFDLRNRIDTTISLLSERIREKPIDLVSIVDESVPQRLIGDPLRLQQVITNLIDNALKFTEQGEVVLEVGVAKEEGGSIELAVSV